MQQKIIITNNNLLFQFSDHNNLLVPKLWKSTRSVIILIRSRGSAIKLYFFSCSMFLSNNFHVSFVLLSKYSGLVYTPIQLHVVFSYKLNLLRSNSKKYHNLKEVYPFEFRKESSVS